MVKSALAVPKLNEMRGNIRGKVLDFCVEESL
jgi:hypothetical protein